MSKIEAIRPIETMRTSVAARRTVDAVVAVIGGSSAGKRGRDFSSPVIMDTTFEATSGNYPRRRSDINARVVVDETIVLDLGTTRIHQLNATASFIWEHCDGRCTVVEIAEKLTGSFDVGYETARRAVEVTLRRLAELGLLDSARA